MSKANSTTVKWSEVRFLIGVYTLYILTITAPLGFIICVLKVVAFKRAVQKNARSVDHEAVFIATHCEWLMRSLVVIPVIAIMGVGLAGYIGWYIVAGAVLTWWFYRLYRGVKSLILYRLMPADICTRALCYGQLESI